MQSPLSGLCEVLKEVKRLAREHSPKNETHTRIMLIDPVLKALGWDVANPHLVEVEKHLESGRNPRYADYILKAKKPRKPIIVEAKKLGDLLDNKEQILYYANRVKSESIFLTDGLKWHHFTNFDASNLIPIEIHLGTTEDVDLPVVAAYLVKHLDSSLFVSGLTETKQNEREKQLLEKIEGLETTIRELGISFRTHSAGHSGIIEPGEPTQPDLPWLSFGGNSWDPKNRRPSLLRLPNDETVEVNRWGQVLSEVCCYCLTVKPELLDTLPIFDKAGRNTRLIDISSSTGNSTQIKIGDKDFFVNILYSATASVANAAYMLGKLGEGAAVKAAVLLAE